MGIEVEKEKRRITRLECALFQKKIVEHNQTMLENNSLQSELDFAKKEFAKNECMYLLGKHSASEQKVKITHDTHLKSMGDVTKIDRF